MIDVLVVGDLNPDIIVWGSDVRPTFRQVEQLVDGVTLTVGGSAGIVACGVARLGLSTELYAVVGDDPLGRLLRGFISARGVGVDGVRVDPALSTGASVILAEPSDRAILTDLGTIAALGAADLEKVPDRAARHVHIASPFLLAGARAQVPAFMHRMRQSGSTVSLDTNWDPLQRWDVDDLLAETDLLLPNEAEVCAIAGAASIDDAIDALSGRIGVIAVKLGAAGGRCRWNDRDVSIRPPSGVAFVDPIGAGDSFDAGFIAALAHGHDPAESLDWAVVTGTFSTRSRGGVDGQPTMNELVDAIGSR
jgi:ribokinase